MKTCIDKLIVEFWFRSISLAWRMLKKIQPRRFLYAVKNAEINKPVDDSGVIFINYNVVLPDGRETFPGRPPLKERPEFKATARLLESIFPGDKSGVRLIDIGCLEGAFTTGFAEMGFDALGLEVREGNVAACEVLRRQFALPNLKFVCDDALNIEKHGRFDVTFCAGLLYHLHDPKSYIETMARITDRVLIINTQIASESFLRAQRYHLSPMVTHEGARGRWFLEFPENIDAKTRDDLRWAAWGNNRSFWMTRGAILQTMRDNGFDLVFEQFDHLEDGIDASMKKDSIMHDARGMFVGIKKKA